MQESAIMEIVKMFITLVIILIFVSLCKFFIDLSTVNSFKQYTSYQIERHGGLTSNAIKNIEDEAKNYYDSNFVVSSDKYNKKVQYGEIVNYVLTAKFEIVIFPVPDVILKFSGSGMSQIR